MNKRIVIALFILATITVGCSSPLYHTENGNTQSQNKSIKSERLLIWSASLSVEVTDIDSSIKQTTDIVLNQNGYIQNKSNNGQKNAFLVLRIPSSDLNLMLDKISKMGEVTSKYLSSKDVTEEYIDVEARLKNKVVLRNRLQKLLDKAQVVKDILIIEKELNRVQSDIDSMQSRIKSLTNKIDFATVEVAFKRKQIPGAVTYVFNGICWGLKKLFVIKE